MEAIIIICFLVGLWYGSRTIRRTRAGQLPAAKRMRESNLYIWFDPWGD